MGTKYEVNSSTGLITTDAGISLPTSGGTADTLDYYEESTHAVDFESTLFSGVLTLDFRIIRVGKLVSLTWGTLFKSMSGGSGSDNITSAATFELPTRFRPLLHPAQAPCRAHSSGSNLASTLRIELTGALTFGAGDFYTNPFTFNIASQIGIYGMSITYVRT